MKKHQVYALAKDAYWLKALTGIADESIAVEPIHCAEGYPKGLDHLPQADPKALFLVDATGQPDVVAVIRWLRDRGWQYVVVVAADPSWREAHAVLREAGAYDYWEKSYIVAVIRRNVKECLTQIKQEEDESIVPVKTTIRIFLSYARKDKGKVKRLYQELSDAGFKPWMDTKDILPGEKWESAIQRAIRDSHFFLACLSANSVNKRGFLQKEISDALGIWREMLDSDIYLIPVRLEDCEVPERLLGFQWVNLFEKGGWTRLVKAIQMGMERRMEEIKPSVQKPVLAEPQSYEQLPRSIRMVAVKEGQMDRTKQKKLLLADNSPDYRRPLRSLLELEGYQVEEAASVEETLEKLEAIPLDLALIDLRLTKDEDDYDISGLAAAKQAGERDIPCIIITAFDSVETTRLALRSRGAEPLAVDYIPKRYGPQALLDAIKVVLSRRAQEPEKAPGDLVVNLEQGLVWYKGRHLDLSRQQYALLTHLYQKKGAVCSPEELLKAVYDEDVPPHQASADKRLERLIARLREKIEDDPTEPRYLLNVPGRGFRLDIGG